LRTRDRLIAAVFGALLSACLTPPAVIDAGEPSDLEELCAAYPAGTEVVSIRVDEGEFLRGLFVPAAEDSPVVLHLFPAGVSVARPRPGLDLLARQLRDLGYASLLVDYAGIGASDGRSSPENLARDARAMWHAAVRRAGGDPSRVAVRATSLGTVAAAHLFAEGVQPAGVALLLPVCGEDVAQRFSREVYGAAAGLAARLLYDSVSDVDPVDSLDSLDDVPLLGLTAREEQLATDAWLERLGRKICFAGGRFSVREGDHFFLGIESLFLFVPEELDFFTNAIACAPPLTADELNRMRIAWCFDDLPTAMPEEGRAALHDLWDPAGPIPTDLLEAITLDKRLLGRYGGLLPHYEPEQIAAMARMHVRGPLRWSVSVKVGPITVERIFDASEVYGAVIARGLTGLDARRTFARLMLKRHRHPDRVREQSPGVWVLEVLEGGVWSPLDLAPRRPESFVQIIHLKGKL
jgi:hypothetical protein